MHPYTWLLMLCAVSLLEQTIAEDKKVDKERHLNDGKKSQKTPNGKGNSQGATVEEKSEKEVLDDFVFDEDDSSDYFNTGQDELPEGTDVKEQNEKEGKANNESGQKNKNDEKSDSPSKQLDWQEVKALRMYRKSARLPLYIEERKEFPMPRRYYKRYPRRHHRHNARRRTRTRSRDPGFNRGNRERLRNRRYHEERDGYYRRHNVSRRYRGDGGVQERHSVRREHSREERRRRRLY